MRLTSDTRITFPQRRISIIAVRSSFWECQGAVYEASPYEKAIPTVADEIAALICIRI